MTVASDGAVNQTYRRSLAAAADPPDVARAAVRLSAALRHLVDTATGSDAPDDLLDQVATEVGSSRVDLQACKLEYSIVSPK